MANFYLIAGFCGFLLLMNSEFQPVRAQTEGALRFAGSGSNSSQGRVEIYHEGQWGTVCDDAFGREEAQVVCRQLGFPPESVAGAKTSTQFGPGSLTSPIWMDDVSCEPTGQMLKDCQFGGWNRSDCNQDHSEDIGVICPQTTVTTGSPGITTTTPSPVGPNPGICTNPDPNVRLQSPGNQTYGVVQLFNRGTNEWGTLCDDTWDINDARVICRMLCYDSANALPGAPSFSKDNITEPMTVKDVHCTGQEANITDCPQSDWAANSCEASEKALVTCAPLDNSAPSKPEPILECTDGLLTATFSTLRDQYLETKHLTVANLSPNVTCNVQYRNVTNFVSIRIPFDECGVQRTYNATHIIYKTIIMYAPTHSIGDISNRNTYMINVQCEMPREQIADKPILPLTETVTQRSQGQFEVSMHFFNDSNFGFEVTEFPLEIPLGEFVTMALALREVDKTLVMVVSNCYATPSNNREDDVKYPLFTDKCAVDSTVSDFPINNTFVGMRWQTFRFVNFVEVHIHCDVLVCGSEEKETSQECDRSCFAQQNGGGRRKRSSYDHPVVYVSSPTIIVYDKEGPVEIIRDPLPTTKHPDLTTKQANLPDPTTKGINPIKDPTTKGSNPVEEPTTKGSNPVKDPTTKGSNPVKDPTTKGSNPVTTKGQHPVTTDSNLHVPTAAPTARPSGNEWLFGTSDASSLTSFTAILCLCCLTSLLTYVL